MTSTQHVRVEGTSYQRGRQYGRQAAPRIRLSVQAYEQTFAHYAGWDWPTVRREAARFEAPIGKVMPAYLEELRGIADGAGLDLADVLAINVRTEVMYAAKARQAPTTSRLPAECSACACVPVPGQKDPVLIGQNWDWLLHYGHRRPPGAPGRPAFILGQLPDRARRRRRAGHRGGPRRLHPAVPGVPRGWRAPAHQP